jgi:phage terminase large subunit-like protein
MLVGSMILAQLSCSVRPLTGGSWCGRTSGSAGEDTRSAKRLNPYDDWIAAGKLTLFQGGDGDVVGFAEVVNTAAASGKLKLIGIDSFGATELGEAFADSRVEVQGVPQGWKLTPCLSWVERRLADDMLRHDASPIMRWNVGNCIVTRSGNAASVSKATVVGAGKIDGVAAMLNAVAACLASPESVSIYDTQDLKWLP